MNDLEKMKEEIAKIKKARNAVYEEITNDNVGEISKINMKIGVTKMVSELIKNLN